MTASLLTTDLSLAPSQLYVADIQTMTRFYRDHVGLETLESSPTKVLLGHDQVGIIELIAKPKLAHAGPREAGLFHNAVLFATRGELSRTVGNLITTQPHLYSGTGDHLVSEAFYFNDPEGNGLELYFDRPETSWTWRDGQIVMDTLYIDPIDYVQSHASQAVSNDRKLGHVHLRVGDITHARTFYVDLLGFDVTATLPGALFVSVAGYHHHIGLNTWLSQDAGPRQPTLGLSDITIHLTSDDDVSNLASRLETAAWPFTHRQGTVLVKDPWGNQLTLTSPSS